MIDFEFRLSGELAAILRAEFDRDELAEQWMANEAAPLDYGQWCDARRSIDTFRTGLRQGVLVLLASDNCVLRYPFAFLDAFTGDLDANGPWIDMLIGRCLAGIDLDATKARLLLECRALSIELQPLRDRF